MILQKVIKNARPTWGIMRQDLSDYLKYSKVSHDGLTDRESKCLDQIDRDGYVIVPGFWPRDKALGMKEKLESFLEIGQNKDFDSGAYLRIWDNRPEDAGIRRIYHVDKLVPELAQFRNEPFVHKIAKAYYGFEIYSGGLVFQHNLKTAHNTRFHHVDWFGKQFKPFLYLDDVDDTNGPFTYIKGTHRANFMRYRKQLFGNKTGSPTSFYESDVRRVIDREVKLCGEAGTLILADVRGLHRGFPQVSRSRSILVNYMYPNPGEISLDK